MEAKCLLILKEVHIRVENKDQSDRIVTCPIEMASSGILSGVIYSIHIIINQAKANSAVNWKK